LHLSPRRFVVTVELLPDPDAAERMPTLLPIVAFIHIHVHLFHHLLRLLFVAQCLLLIDFLIGWCLLAYTPYLDACFALYPDKRESAFLTR